MKKALSLFLALLMLTGCCCVFAAAEEPDLTGYVKLKDPDVDTLEDGDWYLQWDRFAAWYADNLMITGLVSFFDNIGDLSDFDPYLAIRPFSMLSDEEQARIIADVKTLNELWYNPETGSIYVKTTLGVSGFLTPGDEGYDSYARFVRQYSAPDAPATPDTPAASDNSGSSNAAPKLNFFQRIIEWFRNLFAKLFK